MQKLHLNSLHAFFQCFKLFPAVIVLDVGFWRDTPCICRALHKNRKPDFKVTFSSAMLP